WWGSVAGELADGETLSLAHSPPFLRQPLRAAFGHFDEGARLGRLGHGPRLAAASGRGKAELAGGARLPGGGETGGDMDLVAEPGRGAVVDLRADDDGEESCLHHRGRLQTERGEERDARLLDVAEVGDVRDDAPAVGVVER